MQSRRYYHDGITFTMSDHSQAVLKPGDEVTCTTDGFNRDHYVVLCPFTAAHSTDPDSVNLIALPVGLVSKVESHPQPGQVLACPANVATLCKNDIVEHKPLAVNMPTPSCCVHWWAMELESDTRRGLAHDPPAEHLRHRKPAKKARAAGGGGSHHMATRSRQLAPPASVPDPSAAPAASSSAGASHSAPTSEPSNGRFMSVLAKDGWVLVSPAGAELMSQLAGHRRKRDDDSSDSERSK